jgi:ubiquinone biosynthesis protein
VSLTFPGSAGLFVLSLVGVALVAVLTTVVSLRLLGVRRGWTSALLAGVIGWGTALVIALRLADWDWSADDVAIQTFLIGIPTTMAAAVVLDLVARPGSLAMGERAGLVTAPRPVRAVRGRLAVLRRYRQLIGLLRREGFGPLLSSRQRGVRTTETLGIRLRRVLEEAGGVYIKLGQIAATRVDVLPAEVCDELTKLQNRVAPEPVESIRPVLEAELDGPVEHVFAQFDWEPLAAASIAQTYTARLRSGEAVVVKVQRSTILQVMERDLAALALVAGVAQRRTIFGRGMRSGEMLDQFAANLRDELDFRKEADAMREMAASFGPASAVRIPHVYHHLCTRRLLVQERFEGSTVADARQGNGDVDWAGLAMILLRSSLEQVLRAGLFHADPHPGNVFVLADGTLGLIDFGAVGRLDSIQQAAVVDMLAAMGRRDVSLLREGIQRMAEVGEAVDPERLERALARLLANHMRAGGKVQSTVMEDLVRLLTDFGVRLPADVVLLSRALVTLDGTLRVMSPTVSLVEGATEMVTTPDPAPVLDRDALVRDELMAALPHLRNLPERIDRLLTVSGRGELRVRSVVDEDSRRILRTFVNRALLTGVGAVFLVVSAGLVVAADVGPQVSNDATLFEILGYGGLIAGTVLLLRVVAAVARDGTT